MADRPGGASERPRPDDAGTNEDGDDDAHRIVDLLSDEYAWTILEATREQPRSADTLSELCDADPSTVYRRLDRLQEAGLVEDQQELDPGGHHYKVYEATLSSVTVSLGADGFEVDVAREESPADRFTRLYEGFK